MKNLISKLDKYNVSKILIDGALFRKSIASFKIADAAILATGASYSKSLNKVVQHTSLILEELMLDKVDEEIAELLINEEKSLVMNKRFKKTIIDLDTILHNEYIVKTYLDKHTRYLYLNGALTNKLVKVIISKRFELKDLTIIVKDATHIIVDTEYLRKLKLTDTNLLVMNRINILFLTYNPHSSLGYEFDEKNFKVELAKRINIPIINVLEDSE